MCLFDVFQIFDREDLYSFVAHSSKSWLEEVYGMPILDRAFSVYNERFALWTSVWGEEKEEKVSLRAASLSIRLDIQVVGVL